MMNSWRHVTLADLGEIVGGATPSTKVTDYYNGEIAWLTPKDLSNYQDRYISKGERSITQVGLDNCSAKLLPKNTILFTSRAPIGYVAIASNTMCTNQGFKSIIPNSSTDYMFLYYLLKYNKNNIESMGSGTTFKEVSTATMKKINVFVPPLAEQKAIADTLSCLDDKIELNNKIIKNLEEQAQAIFKNWFVDFEPFGGKMPEDWRMGTLGECIDLFDNQRIPLSSRERQHMEKIYPYYGATSILDYVDDYLFDGTYILFGEDGTVSTSNGCPILQYVWGKFWVNNHAHVLRPKNTFSIEALYMFLKNTNVEAAITGAVQLKINQNNLKALPLLIATDNIILNYNDIIKPLFSKIRTHTTEIAKLAQLRDTLLPKLMSGEVRVPYE